MPGGDLLSHGEAPHYHRRRAVSLPSSGWDRVVPTRYCRQTNWPDHPARALRHLNSECILGDVYNSDVSDETNHQHLGCYMVKPHGQLVLVSCTRYRASTPSLSTL